MPIILDGNGIIKNINFQHPSASATNLSLNSDGTIGNLAISNYPGRNRLINGSFAIWQRGNTATFCNAGTYLADRWTPNLYQDCVVQRISNSYTTSGPSSIYSARVGSPSTAQNGGGSRMTLSQIIESVNSIPLRGKTVTLSFWIRFSSSTFSSVSNSGESSYGNFLPALWFMTSTTDGSSISTYSDSSYNIVIPNGSLPTSWIKYQFTTTVPTNANNIVVRFSFDSRGSTSSSGTNWYEIAEVQLEEGSIATPFEFKNYGQELRECQRYYQLIDHLNLFAARTSTQIESSIMFNQWMRSAPVIDISSPTTAVYNIYDAYGGSFTQSSKNVIFAVNGATSKGAFINLGNFSGLTQGRTYVTNAASSGAFGLSSEL